MSDLKKLTELLNKAKTPYKITSHDTISGINICWVEIRTPNMPGYYGFCFANEELYPSCSTFVPDNETDLISTLKNITIK